MTAPRPFAPREKSCASCGAPFGCGPGTGVAADRCWCQDQPLLPDIDPAADCFCPACLSAKLAAVQVTGPK